MSPTAPPEIAGLVYVEPLGSGGYADVYLYEQQMPRMPVAVKVLKGEGMTDGHPAAVPRRGRHDGPARRPPLHRPGVPVRDLAATAAPTW